VDNRTSKTLSSPWTSGLRRADRVDDSSALRFNFKWRRPRAIRGFAALGRPNPECRFWVRNVPNCLGCRARKVPPSKGSSLCHVRTLSVWKSRTYCSVVQVLVCRRIGNHPKVPSRRYNLMPEGPMVPCTSVLNVRSCFAYRVRREFWSPNHFG
jgi:hypothetical protein